MSDIITHYHRIAEKSVLSVGGLFENTVRKIYEAWLRPGDNAVDVGANFGQHLFPMAEIIGPKGRLYAFEPIHRLNKKLKKKIRKRGLKSIKLYECALGQTAGSSAFSYFEKRPAYSGLRQRHTPFDVQEAGLTEITVKCATLDSKMPWLRKISLIKLDIEGGELHALMGGKHCLQKSRPCLIFENGRQDSAEVYGYGADDFFQFFNSMNMKVFWLDGVSFTRENWHDNIACWEFVALPNEKAEWATTLPKLCHEVLDQAELDCVDG
jgi:FkbM family methyltransferase